LINTLFRQPKCYHIYHSISCFEFQQASLERSIMDIVTSVGSKLFELDVDPVDPIMRQARYALFYKCNFMKLPKDLKDLEAARERVKHSIEEAKSNGEEIENDVEIGWKK